MAIMRLFNETTQAWEEVPALVGKKGDTGAKGDKGDTYTITSADYDAIADVVISKLPTAESEEF